MICPNSNKNKDENEEWTFCFCGVKVHVKGRESDRYVKEKIDVAKEAINQKVLLWEKEISYKVDSFVVDFRMQPSKKDFFVIYNREYLKKRNLKDPSFFFAMKNLDQNITYDDFLSIYRNIDKIDTRVQNKVKEIEKEHDSKEKEEL